MMNLFENLQMMSESNEDKIINVKLMDVEVLGDDNDYDAWDEHLNELASEYNITIEANGERSVLISGTRKNIEEFLYSEYFLYFDSSHVVVIDTLKEAEENKPNIDNMSPKRRKIWNAIEISDIPNEDKVAFFNVWLSRLPLGSKISDKIRQELNSIDINADTWSKAGEKENPKVAEILYNSVSKETLDKYRNLSIPTSKEKSELKKSFKSNVTDVINEIISYIKSSGYDMVTPRNPYTNVSNFTMSDFKKGICTGYYKFIANDVNNALLNELNNHILSIINDNGFEYKMDHRQNPLEILGDELTLAFNIQKQY